MSRQRLREISERIHVLDRAIIGAHEFLARFKDEKAALEAERKTISLAKPPASPKPETGESCV